MNRLAIAALLALAPPAVITIADDACVPEDDCGATCGEGCSENAADDCLGGLCGSSTFTGDWGGFRTSLADHGITFQGNTTQFYSGVTHGGINTGFEYGGHSDYILDFDGDKLAGMKGGFLRLRAENRYGRTINAATGAFLPANLAPSLPVADSTNLYLTNVLFTQFLSETCAVYFGKLDTLDGDKNAFASGRGKDQFSNIALVANPVMLRAVPYATLGAGLLLITGPDSTINIGVLNSVDTASTSGFDELFNDGATITAEARYATTFFGKPGHQLIGAAWNSRTFVALDQDPRIVLPPLGIPIARTDGSWAAYYNFDQYLVSDPNDPTQGWGVFGRVGISDGNPNPLEYFLSFGIGGSSPVKGREKDTFGIGWYQNGVTSKLGTLATAFLGPTSGKGVEVFYNYEVCPWFHITPDVQYIRPGSRNRADDAFVVGVRARIDL